MTSKFCKKCQCEKSLIEFSNQANAPDGLSYACKKCDTASAMLWNKNNAAHVTKMASDRWKNNKDKLRQKHKDWVDKNKSSVAKYMRDWREKNKQQELLIAKKSREKSLDKRLALNGKRRAVKKSATPEWANLFFIAEAHALARLRTNITGIKWHVDHIVPLKAKTVCGLHAHTNIQVITEQENMKKRNWLWPDMPGRLAV